MREQRGEFGLLRVGEAGDGVVADELDELLEARAAAVVRGLEEPLELAPCAAPCVQPVFSMRSERAYSICSSCVGAVAISAMRLGGDASGACR